MDPGIRQSGITSLYRAMRVTIEAPKWPKGGNPWFFVRSPTTIIIMTDARWVEGLHPPLCSITFFFTPHAPVIYLGYLATPPLYKFTRHHVEC